MTISRSRRIARSARAAIFAGAIAATAALGIHPAFADITLLQRESGPSPDGGEDRVTEKEISITQDKMRIRDTTTGDVVIVRLDMRVVWEIPPQSNEYIEIPFSYLEKMKDVDGMTDAEISEAQLQLAQPDERAQAREDLDEVREQLGDEIADEQKAREELAKERTQLANRKPSVRWTGRTEKIAGFSSKEAVLEVDKTKVAEVWVTKDPLFKDDLAAYMEAMRSLGPAGSAPTDELGGFPLRTILYPMSGRGEKPLVLEIVEAHSDAIGPWEFDLPPGVKRAPFLPPMDTE
jgi:uncharacterized protein DUF4412